jgi:hypothetical protein
MNKIKINIIYFILLNFNLHKLEQQAVEITDKGVWECGSVGVYFSPSHLPTFSPSPLMEQLTQDMGKD